MSPGDDSGVRAVGAHTPSRNPRALAERLLAVGVPVIVVRDGDTFPSGWERLSADQCDLRGFRPGKDALALVGGHGIDVVDEDSKVGGSVDALPPFRSYGVTRTPSGGRHFIVPSTGLGKITPLVGVGDYVGGRPDGGSRLLAYLPGSVRPKYPDGGYVEEVQWDVEACVAATPEAGLVAAAMIVLLLRRGLGPARVRPGF